MRPPGCRAPVVISAATGFLLVLGATGAHAQAPQQQGWWSVTSAGGSLANPADVPADGLLVQAGPASADGACDCAAYAGVVYQLPEGTSASTLTLKVAPGSATTPISTLQVCGLVDPVLRPAQGGPLAEAPDYDCAREKRASLDDSASSFTFDVASLVVDGTLALAILPGDSTSRVVLSKPDDSSLTTVAGPADGPFAQGGPPARPSSDILPTESGGSSGGGGPAASGGSTAGLITSSLVPPPVALPRTDHDPPVAAPAEPMGSLDTAPTVAARVAAPVDSPDGANPAAVLLALGSLLIGSLLWAVPWQPPPGDAPDD